MESFGPLSKEGLDLWCQLPEAIRLDPSLTRFQKEHGEYFQITAESDNSEARADITSSNIMSHCTQIEINHADTMRKQTENFDESSEVVINANEYEGKNEGIKHKSAFRYTKLILLCCCWIAFTVILMRMEEKEYLTSQIAIPVDEIRNFSLVEYPIEKRIGVMLQGAFLSSPDTNISMRFLTVWFELSRYDSENSNDSHEDTNVVKNVSDPWIIPLVIENSMDTASINTLKKVFELNDFENTNSSRNIINIKLKTDSRSIVPLVIGYDLFPINTEIGIIYAAIILIGLYILIIFEIIHKALATLLASTMSIAILAALNERPTMIEIMTWLDIDTLLLLFSMMLLVAIFAETGIFDYLAVYAYKITGGKVWQLINALCFFTAFLSALLDNVTTLLLMAPVTIRMCQVMKLDPVPILIAIVIYSNIGGTITPIGDPPNIIIATNRYVINGGVDFSLFTIHMAVGIAMVLFVVYCQFRFLFRDLSILRSKDSRDVQELKLEIEMWKKVMTILSNHTENELVMREELTKKIQDLFKQLKAKLRSGNMTLENFKANLDNLQEKYPIKDKWLLTKSGLTLFFVILLFFLHSVLHLNISLGWTSLLGALLLLIIADSENLDHLMEKIEWSTLLFFAALFILMEALSRLGLIAWIGSQTEQVILSVNEEFRLAVAILLILWISSIASAFIDNIPLTTMMIRIIISLAENRELRLPLQPLVWALAFGACLGGNGTLIGAGANVICAGVAEKHGYQFTFLQFFKIGFPVLITSTATVTVYLMIAHVAFDWNGPQWNASYA